VILGDVLIIIAISTHEIGLICSDIDEYMIESEIVEGI
jgi:hypothetical protein